MILVIRMERARQLGEPVRDAMRLERARGAGDEVRVLEQSLDQRLLFGGAEQGEVDVAPRGDGDALLRRLAVDRADARVGVLHVVDGIVARLARGHREIELERAVVAPREKREARGVAPHFLQQLLHQDELAAALGHAHRLAVTQQRHELDDQRLERIERVAERGHRRAHARHVAVVVGAEQIDHMIDAREFHEVMIGDVDGKVGELARAPAQHTVLVIAGAGHGRRAKPQRAVVLVRQPTRGELLHRLLHQAAVTHVALLGRPHVELHAVGRERAALLRDHELDRPAAEMLEARARVAGHVEPSALRAILRGEVDQVLARIPFFGQRGLVAEGLTHARLERARERLELRAGIVDVELRRDARALRAQEARERVADGGGARVDDHQRSGRIRGDELEPPALPGMAGAAPVIGAGLEDVVQRAGRPCRREEDVEEAGARDFHAGDLGHGGKVLRERIGDLAGRPLGGTRQGHRDVRRVVAVLGLAWHLPRTILGRGQPRRRQRRAHPVRQPLGDRHGPEPAALPRRRLIR